jgi:hypothetical protein
MSNNKKKKKKSFLNLLKLKLHIRHKECSPFFIGLGMILALSFRMSTPFVSDAGKFG